MSTIETLERNARVRGVLQPNSRREGKPTAKKCASMIKPYGRLEKPRYKVNMFKVLTSLTKHSNATIQ